MRAALRAGMRLVLAALLVASIPSLARADVSVHADVNVDVTVGAPAPAPATAPAAAPAVAPSQPAPPAPSVSAEPEHPVSPEDRLHPGTIGLSLFASSGALIDTGERVQGDGFAVRLHPLDRYPIEVAIETERDTYDGDMRTDWRIGYSIHYTIATDTFVSPYLVFPMGVNIVEVPGHDAFAQGYIGIGAGLAVHLGAHWLATADARVVARNEQTQDGMAPVLGPERVGELRGAAVYYF